MDPRTDRKKANIIFQNMEIRKDRTITLALQKLKKPCLKVEFLEQYEDARKRGKVVW